MTTPRGLHDLILQRLRLRQRQGFPPELLASQFDALEELDAAEAIRIDVDGLDVGAVAQHIRRRLDC